MSGSDSSRRFTFSRTPSRIVGRTSLDSPVEENRQTVDASRVEKNRSNHALGCGKNLRCAKLKNQSLRSFYLVGKGDRLILRGLRFHGKHGVLEEERILGQKFDVDVDAWMDLSKAGETDQLEDSVNYADIYSQIKAIVEGSPHFLLESVATAIAKAVLEKHPQISDVRVRVGKPHVAVDGVLDVLGVEIFRSSSQFTKHHNTEK